MSSGVLGLVGAGLGGLFGGAAWAQYGMVAGSMLGGMLFKKKTVTEGPRIEQAKIQTSCYGQSLMRAYGTFRMAGQLIWVGTRQEVVSTNSTSTGKGDFFGASSSTTSYSYYQSVGLSLGKGPITSVLRAWAGTELIYDSASNKNPFDMQIQLGTETQARNDTMVSEQGIADTPAYRGQAYVVFPNFPLTSFGGAIPQFSFEVLVDDEALGGTVVQPEIDDSNAPMQAMSALQTAPAGLNIFHTPVAYYKGNIYIITMEPSDGPGNGINLKTVVRKGTFNGTTFVWTSKLIEPRTINDAWHTAGSIVVDRNGYIHIAYNHHNMPWQYARSTNPEDISSFDFLGEAVSDYDIQQVRYENLTDFNYIGEGAIPGTQITYPAFFTDRNGDIYVTYRFALRPKASFTVRQFSAGLAKYNATTRQWTALGASIAVSEADADIRTPGTVRQGTAIASEMGWWAMDLRLTFDENNVMHMAWVWADYTAPTQTPRHAYAYSPDGVHFFKSNGVEVTLPFTRANCDLIEPDYEYSFTPYINLKNGLTGAPVIMTIAPNLGLCYIIRDTINQLWMTPIQSPWGAAPIVIDVYGGCWAFATGLAILYSTDITNPNGWSLRYSENDEWGYTKYQYIPSKDIILLYLTKAINYAAAPDRYSSDTGDVSVRVVRLKLSDLRP